jgi:hypothetical protein
MDVEAFWALIERGRDTGGDDPEAVIEHVVTELAVGPDEKIFGHWQVQAQLERRAYDWRLWAAAYLIHGGCSDDSFSDFRAGLILHGRNVFERAVEDPDSLADLPLVQTIAGSDDDDDQEILFFEDANYIAVRAYERHHEQTDDDHGFWAALEAVPDLDDGQPSDPTGELFDFDDDEQMRQRLPRLFALFAEER